MTDESEKRFRLQETAIQAYDPSEKPTVQLRAKNQLTIPKSIADKVEAEPGDRFVVDVDPDEPNIIRLRRLRRSYAGIYNGMWGDHEDVLTYLDELRSEWRK